MHALSAFKIRQGASTASVACRGSTANAMPSTLKVVKPADEGLSHR